MKSIKLDPKLFGLPSSVEVFTDNYLDASGADFILNIYTTGYRLIATLSTDYTVYYDEDEDDCTVEFGDFSLDDSEYVVGEEPSGFDLGGWFTAEELPEELISEITEMITDVEKGYASFNDD